jgi:endonuclease/exonuclease/phosphatase family metal-dependent hydrolase
MTSRALHRPTARLLSAAVSAVLLATAGPVVATASAPGAAPDARARLRHHPHYLLVATWNVGGILTDGRGGTPHARWKARRTVVVRQLLAQAPVGQRGRAADVIALQEANSEKKLPTGRTQYTDLVHLLNVRATGRDRYRALSRTLHSKATRIAYNARTVRLLKAGVVRWRAQESRADGPRLMAWARFEHRSTGRRFFFASVHLETASKSVRKRQWKELLRVAPRLAHGRPVIIAGDFNSTRNQKGNAAEKFLPKMKKAGFGDTLGQTSRGNLKVTLARPHRLTRANFNSVNFYHRRLGHSWNRRYVGQDVDYIFASNRLEVRGWSLVADLAPGGKKLEGVIPSDHNLIRARLVIKR